MDLYRAKKGVVITTSNFTRDAIDFAERVDGKKVVLIDGIRLTELMIEFNVGVIVSKQYDLKEVSNGFFDEEGV
jgi:restriction system protein